MKEDKCGLCSERFETYGLKVTKEGLTTFPIIEEDWVSFGLNEQRRSGVIVRKNKKTFVVKPAVFTEGKLYRRVHFESPIKIRIKKSSIREYPVNTRPIF